MYYSLFWIWLLFFYASKGHLVNWKDGWWREARFKEDNKYCFFFRYWYGCFDFIIAHLSLSSKITNPIYVISYFKFTVVAMGNVRSTILHLPYYSIKPDSDWRTGEWPSTDQLRFTWVLQIWHHFSEPKVIKYCLRYWEAFSQLWQGL